MESKDICGADTAGFNSGKQAESKDICGADIAGSTQVSGRKTKTSAVQTLRA